MSKYCKMRPFISSCAMTIALLASSFIMHSQVRFSLHSADSLPFILFLQGQQVNNMACHDITLADINSGKTQVKVNFGLNSDKVIDQVLNLKDQTQVGYEIRMVKNAWKLVLANEANYTGNSQVLIDSTQVAVDMPSAPIPAESGGCGAPMNSVDFDHLKRQLSEMHFEAKKVDTIKIVISSNCMSVEQLRYLLANLEMEENKLHILSACKGHVSDVSRLSSVTEDFFLEKNKQKARAILDNWNSQ